MRRHAEYADGGDLPYDRELIRSGGVTSGRDARRGQPQARRTAPRPRPRPRRRRRSFGRTLGLVLLIALIGVGVIGVMIGARAAAFNATVSSAAFPSSALFFPLNGSDRVNVLMVGYGGGDHDGAYLADSIQILSIDPTTDTTTTIPIPRDLWIEGVAAFPQNGKVNEVFSIGHLEGGLEGAGDKLAQVLTDVTGIQLDHWMSIDFAGFQEMVDAVGGVTVTNPTPFCWTTIEEFHRQGRWEMGCFEAGEIHLDGDDALIYARARYTSDPAESTDFARSVRQARILGGLRTKVGAGGLGSIGPGLGLMDAMEDRIRTNVSVIDLFLLSSHLSSDRRIELTEGPVLTATTNTIGQYILIPTGWTGPGDYGRLRDYLATELAKPIGEASPNGTDAP